MAAAGADARMSGCELPVVINSGSGNQGITASVPVVVWAREKGYDEARMYRALAVSNLLAIHQKAYIGVLSAYCGAVSAGSAAAAGIAYLEGGGYDAVAHTVVNALAITSGVICDGAKASCAGKIAVAVESGVLGYLMYRQGRQFWSGEGIVSKSAGEQYHPQCGRPGPGRDEGDRPENRRTDAGQHLLRIRSGGTGELLNTETKTGVPGWSGTPVFLPQPLWGSCRTGRLRGVSSPDGPPARRAHPFLFPNRKGRERKGGGTGTIPPPDSPQCTPGGVGRPASAGCVPTSGEAFRRRGEVLVRHARGRAA